jgi:uncharacterized protein (DUF952 family)
MHKECSAPQQCPHPYPSRSSSIRSSRPRRRRLFPRTFLYLILTATTAISTYRRRTVRIPDVPFACETYTDFVHYGIEVPGTADKFFGHVSELWLLKIKYDVLAAGTNGDGKVHVDPQAEVRWEEVGRGCFAHLYHGDLGNGNVAAAYKVERGAGTWTESLSLEA